MKKLLSSYNSVPKKYRLTAVLVILIAAFLALWSPDTIPTPPVPPPEDLGANTLPEHAQDEEKSEEEKVSTDAYYPVVRVVDGDTIKIQMGDKVETLRLIGIDTPESVDPRKTVQCFGIEASNKAKELLFGRTIRIEADESQDVRDKYGRLLAYVYRDDGLFYNQYMIEEGYAYEYTYDVPYLYQTAFKEAEQQARGAQKGLWNPEACDGARTL